MVSRSTSTETGMRGDAINAGRSSLHVPMHSRADIEQQDVAAIIVGGYTIAQRRGDRTLLVPDNRP
jgi:hypothetical protein